MQVKIVNLNEGKHEFSLSVIDEKEWKDLALNIALTKNDTNAKVDIEFLKVSIRDNVAKLKMAIQGNSYIELSYVLDQFGNADAYYSDDVSQLFRGIMSAHYGEAYDNALMAKRSEVAKKL